MPPRDAYVLGGGICQMSGRHFMTVSRQRLDNRLINGFKVTLR